MSGNKVNPVDPPEKKGTLTADDLKMADADLARENAELKAGLAEVMRRLAQVEAMNAPTVAEKPKDGKPVLDRTRPVTTQRQIGGAWHEQDGKKFSMRGEYIGPIGKK
jgi:hypothetical protein